MPGFQDKVAVEDEGERQPRPIGERGLHVEATIDQPVANHREAVAGPAADRLGQIVLALTGSGL